MADLFSNSAGRSNSLISQLQGSSSSSSSAATGERSTTLQQEDFFKLLTQQLSYQDPTKPADNAEMISQMTAFTTAQGISNMSKQLSSLNDTMTSSQALMASSLVGQKVLIPSDTGYLPAGGAIDWVIPAGDGASDLSVNVQDESGQVLRTVSLEGLQLGNVPFSWDGLDNQGNAVAAGQYQLVVNGRVGTESQALGALTYGKVDSVTLGNASNPTMVNLQGLGNVQMSQIMEVSKYSGV